MSDRSQGIEALVTRAYNRSLLALLLEHAALAASLVLLGMVVILFTGVQIFDWYWLAILGLAGLIAGYFRVRNRIPTRYRVAQVIDHNLDLHDTLSSAWFLGEHPELAETTAGNAVLRRAERLADDIDVRVVFPFRGRREWALAGGLAAVACGLFTARYLVQHDLRLDQSLIPVRFDRLADNLREKLTPGDRGTVRQRSLDQNAGKTEQASMRQPDDPRMSDVVGVKNPASPAAEEQQTRENPPSNPTGHNSSQIPNGAKSADGETKQGSTPASAQESTQANNEASDSANPPSGSQQARARQQGQGLMNKMKDAVSSLMAKMRSSELKKGPQSATRNAAAPDQDQNQSQGEPSQGQSSASQTAGRDTASESKGQEQGSATETAESAQSRSTQGSDSQGGNQSKSGIGKQDGEKALKERQELAAMGKLADIVGKRSQDVTGEMMVETPSGKQQLRTAYSDKVAQHTDAGGEINRDEVPLMFQQYVREYMERVHQQAQKQQ